MAETQFSYVAIDPAGRRTKGVVSAFDQSAAFNQLKRAGFSPLSLRHRNGSRSEPKVRAVSIRESAEFLASLAELLRAGADIRTALGVLGDRFEKPAVKALSVRLAEGIGGGEALDRAFLRSFPAEQSFVAPMVAAGEAAGDLSGGLERAAEVIQARLKLRDQLITVMAYPTFVLASAFAAVLVILLFIIPSIAPLTEELGGEPPLSLRVMMGASDILRHHGGAIASVLVATIAGLGIGWRLGVFSELMGRLLLDGPLRRTVAGLVFGSFAISLGTMTAAGAPLGDALRLALRTTSLAVARRRLEPVAQQVRQGESLSTALADVKSFPRAIIRLTAVGEASNAVGGMLLRSGRMEEDGALRRIETIGRIAGPALIVLLGAILGVMMAGLLSGVSQVGQAALE